MVYYDCLMMAESPCYMLKKAGLANTSALCALVFGHAGARLTNQLVTRRTMQGLQIKFMLSNLLHGDSRIYRPHPTI